MILTESELDELKYLLRHSNLGTLSPAKRMELISLIKKEMPEADINTPDAQNYIGRIIVGKIELEKFEKIRSGIPVQ